MNVHDIKQAVEEARRTQRMADRAVKEMLHIIKGRLRAATKGGLMSWDAEALKEIKRELRNFDIRTGSWKEQPK